MHKKRILRRIANLKETIMAFRADEATKNGNETALEYLIDRSFTDTQRIEAKEAVHEIIEKCGPRVSGYPLWHPLVCNQKSQDSLTNPCEQNGYSGLDHTVLFSNGFITCPYNDGQSVIDSVERLPDHHSADIIAERLETPLYNTGTTPILVYCDWHDGLDNDGLIPKKVAVPLMIENTLPIWKWSTRAERWETMRPYLLGMPHGARSSLFVSQETALAMKKIHNTMNETGMFGPLKMD
jgi:hypothetical protein